MNRKNLSRRDFLTISAAASAGLLGVANGLALGQATATPAPTNTPAPLPVGQEGVLTVIHKTEYFEEVQTLFREFVVDWTAERGIQLDISTANPEIFGDFLARMLAAVQAGNPPDLGYHVLSIPQMYALDIVEDVTDVVEQVVSLYGNVVPATAAANAFIDDKWWAVPFMSVVGVWFARKDIFDAAGIDLATLDTWDARREAALAVSDPENNIWGWGVTVNRSGDAHGFIEDVFQAWGGSFTDETGLVVTFNSPEMIEAITWLAETYTSERFRPMLPPGIESWTDTSNNEAYLAGTIALTSNQPSIYAAAKASGNPVYENTALMHKPKTQDGRLLEAGSSGWLTIFKGAPNLAIAKELMVALLDPENIVPMAQLGGGLFNPAYESLWTDDLIAADPNFAVIRDIIFNPDLYYGRSHPAHPNALIDAIDAAGITSQMMANIINGSMTVEEAVLDAHNRIVQIFEEGGVPQS